MQNKDKPVAKIESTYMKQYDAYIERRRKRKQRLIRRLVLFTIVVTITISMMATYHLKQRSLYTEKQEEYEQLQNELATLKEEEEALMEEVELLKDEEYVLEIARTNYFFSKEGELIFKIPDKEDSY